MEQVIQPDRLFGRSPEAREGSKAKAEKEAER